MKILAALGSMKDVFSPAELCSIVGKIVSRYHDVTEFPMCDGGEYTLDVLKYYSEYREHYVENVINPYGKRIRARYLSADGCAFIASSEIIRLSPYEDIYKNPLELTDYGLGQVVASALSLGFKKINLCLGGTSTVCFGMGMAQALGVVFYDFDGSEMKKPLTPKEFYKIQRYARSDETYFDNITVISDGITKASQLNTVNPQKIGKNFGGQKEQILESLRRAACHAERITGLSMDDEFSGNAGGIYYGLELSASAEYLQGPVYFMNAFGLADSIKDFDLVITGEGRFDNIHLNKLPVAVCKLARQFGIPAVFICGQKDPCISKQMLESYGIIDVICCQDFYQPDHTEVMNELELAGMYKKQVPFILENEISRRIVDWRKYAKSL